MPLLKNMPLLKKSPSPTPSPTGSWSNVVQCAPFVHPSPSSGALSTLSTRESSSNSLRDLGTVKNVALDSAHKVVDSTAKQWQQQCQPHRVVWVSVLRHHVAMAAAIALAIAISRRWLRTRRAKVIATALGIGAASPLLVWLKRTWQHYAQGWKTILLDEFECTIGMALPAVSAATFYKGESMPKDALREKVDSMLQSNPWLAGRLHTLPAWMHTCPDSPEWYSYLPYQTVLMVPPAPDVDSYFVQLGDIGLTPHMDYNEVLKVCKKHVPTMQEGFLSMLKHTPLFQVTLVPAGSSHFVVIVTLSHAVADGHTFYTLHSMLDEHTPVHALDRETGCWREKDAAKAATFGLHKLDSYWDPRKLMLQLWASLMRPRIKSSVYRLSTHWLQEEKARAVQETSGRGFVSTNDVLTSWFCRITECTSGWMAFNFRNRADGLTDWNAGNYEGIVGYWPEEYDSPLKIRQSLKTFETAREDTPGYVDNFTGHFTGITNWSSFYKTNNFAGSKSLYHIPTMDCTNINTWATMVIFKADADNLGLCIFSRDKELMARIEDSPAVEPWWLNQMPGFDHRVST